MNRKKFLQKTSSGVLAAAFLPLLSFKSVKKTEYKTYESVKKTTINGTEWSFALDIEDRLIKDFDNATQIEKEIEIYCESARNNLALIYIANSIKMKTVDDKFLHFITFKIGNGDMEKEEDKFATDHFGKTLIFEVHDKCHVVIRNEKTNLEINLKYDGTANSDELDCFLTSACVFHKGLADDCQELTTLRNLRENNMKPNLKYQKLISEYEIIAPKMLLNIANAENKNEILDAIYTQLVVPSVSLVEQGKEEEAIKYYADFVNEMKSIYL